MALNCYLSNKTIWIDSAGWSDLLLGVVVCVLKPPDPMLLERRISVSSFQSPNFQSKKYLSDAVRIANEIVSVMQPDSDTCIKVCSEYVLSGVIEHLKNQGFNVQKVESTGELAVQTDKAYIRWCIEKGVPEEILRDKKRFFAFVDWVAEAPHLRESLVKTGWDSWEGKWKAEVARIHQEKRKPQN
ncbi:MAG: hypothetical protein NWF01_01060 [Candidatus Bathyarchaeota archaeon]|nr:hypothetical protein [Candidatus Bathyarchaeota archaeon]